MLNRSTQPLLLTLIAGMVLTSTPARANDEVAELKAMMKNLQARLDTLEQKQTPAPAPAAASASTKYVEAGELPGSFKLPGSETSIKLYGNVRIDTTYDFKGRIGNVNSYGWGNSLFLQPFDDSPAGKRHGQTYATARASRFGFITSTPTADFGPVMTKLEGDFDGLNTLGGETSTTLRLREAYAKAGGLLVGQTYSTFTDLRAQPDLVEWNGTGITPTIRQAMVRYSLPAGERSWVDLALENTIGGTWARSPVGDFDNSYDLVAGFTHDTDWGHVSVRGVSNAYKNDADSKRGYGVALSSRLKLGARDSVVFQVAGGEGIGRYMYNGVTQGAVNTSDGIHLWKGWGAHLGYTHKWSDALRSSAAIATTRFDRDDLANATQRANSPAGADFYPNERLEQIWLNTFWTPYRSFDIGFDYTYGTRETFEGEKGTISRLSTMVRYAFN